jgi:hypothetical protein
MRGAGAVTATAAGSASETGPYQIDGATSLSWPVLSAFDSRAAIRQPGVTTT